ncbi:hypothetical protein J5O04_12295 [Corynebacterium hindlerae]|uniref:hypothetical protein n=1 Tax=Corynebacterium hindlerae TaxID=699041 RepID=UPI001AD7D7FA|nr:hypothetical protein [Corynebacterium hindlerae]QTH59538.1 hypothetical protein J5O04_12295 [Corynebacterium hindlerae]
MRKALFTSALAISLAVSALTAPNAQAVELPPVPDYLKLKIKQSAEHPPAPGENSNINDKEAEEWAKQVKELFQKASPKEYTDLRKQLLKVDPGSYLHTVFPDLAKVLDKKDWELLDAEREAETEAESPTEKEQQDPPAAPEVDKKQEAPAAPEADKKQQDPAKPEGDNKQDNPAKPEGDKKQENTESDADGGLSSDSAFGIVDVILSALGTIGVVFGIGTVINNFLKSNGLPHF